MKQTTVAESLDTINANGLQPYLSAVNKFVYKDHGREPFALGDVVARVRKGFLAAAHVSLAPTLIRAPFRARVMQQATVRAQEWRI
jgi:hypothetical protein